MPSIGTIVGLLLLSAGFATLFTWLLSLLAFNPLSYLEGFGERTYNSVPLLWWTIGVSLGVIFFTIFIVLHGIYRHRAGPNDPQNVTRPPGGVAWIFTGVGISTLFLLGTVIWTTIVLRANSAPARTPAIRLAVIGHQWWWEVHYLSETPSKTFATADEIHIPVGQPVEINLSTADVIHSFWVPKLAGKTDLIPGQTNKTWIEASKPGVYRAQCMEYCGVQHAHMAFVVTADPPSVFNAWWDHMLKPQAPPETPAGEQYEAAFIQKCGSCHAVRGTRAGGILGPNLSHLMTRTTIAAGTLPNTVGYLSGWIANPQDIKPGNYMPRLDLSGPELNRVREFLKTLN